MSPNEIALVIRRLDDIEDKLDAHLLAHDELTKAIKKGLLRFLFGALAAAGASLWAWLWGHTR